MTVSVHFLQAPTRVPWEPTLDKDKGFVLRSLLVPQDIIDLIADTLGGAGHVEELKACSLVHSAFLHPCRKHIFATVYLMPIGPPSDVKGTAVLGGRLFRVLQQSPHIASYVRSLSIHADTAPDLDWMLKSQEMSSILDILTNRNLRTFEFQTGAYSLWEFVAPSIRTSLTSLIASRQLEHLTLRGLINLPTSLSEYFGSLITLYLWDVAFIDDPPFNLDESNSESEASTGSSTSLLKGKVRSLSVQGSDPFVGWLFHAKTINGPFIDYDRFTFLDIQLDENPALFQFLSKFLHRATHLQDLHFKILSDVNEHCLAQFLVHKKLASMRRISFFVDPPTLLRYIHYFVQSLPSPSDQPHGVVERIDVICALRDDARTGIAEMALWKEMRSDLPFKDLLFYMFLAEDVHGEGEEGEDSLVLTDKFQKDILAVTSDTFRELFKWGFIRLDLQFTPRREGEDWALTQMVAALEARSDTIGLY